MATLAPPGTERPRRGPQVPRPRGGKTRPTVFAARRHPVCGIAIAPAGPPVTNETRVSSRASPSRPRGGKQQSPVRGMAGRPRSRDGHPGWWRWSSTSEPAALSNSASTACASAAVRHLVIFAHERLHRVQGVEPHQGHELHIVISLAPDQVHGAEPGNAPRLNARDYLTPHDALIGLSVVPGGPARHRRQIMDASLRTGPASPPCERRSGSGRPAGGNLDQGQLVGVNTHLADSEVRGIRAAPSQRCPRSAQLTAMSSGGPNTARSSIIASPAAITPGTSPRARAARAASLLVANWPLGKSPSYPSASSRNRPGPRRPGARRAVGAGRADDLRGHPQLCHVPVSFGRALGQGPGERCRAGRRPRRSCPTNPSAHSAATRDHALTHARRQDRDAAGQHATVVACHRDVVERALALERTGLMRHQPPDPLRSQPGARGAAARPYQSWFIRRVLLPTPSMHGRRRAPGRQPQPRPGPVASERTAE